MSVDALEVRSETFDIDKQGELQQAIARRAVRPLIDYPERSPIVRDGGAMLPSAMGRDSGPVISRVVNG